jgi:hypothetical protein
LLQRSGTLLILVDKHHTEHGAPIKLIPETTIATAVPTTYFYLKTVG